MIDPLSRLAILSGTDKFGFHDYTPVYHDLLQHLRDAPLRMLEIGVGGYNDEDRGGESLCVWRDYFPNAQITGIDIQKKTMDLGPRVKILQGSQIDAEFLSALVKDRGPFDVILDDGSHRNEHVIESFGILFPDLTPGGIYIAEDVQTSFFPRYGGSLALTQPNSVGFFLTMMQSMRGDVVAIERFHNIIAIHKRNTDEETRSYRTHRALQDADPARVQTIAAGDFTPELLAEAVDTVGEGGLVCLAGWPKDNDVLRQLFVQIDHREIAVAFPDAPIDPLATKVLGMAAFRDGAVLMVGENTYPSNFAWAVTHPRVAAAVAAMDQVLQSDEARATGVLQLAGIRHRIKGPEAAYPLLDRLEQSGCTERRFYQMSSARAVRQGDMHKAEAVFQAALTSFPAEPEFSAALARIYLRSDRQDQAEALLRTAYAANPRSRPIILMLAELDEKAGRIDDALDLYDASINMFPRPDRAARFRHFIALAQSAGQNARVIRACKRWLVLEPEATEPARLLEEVG